MCGWEAAREVGGDREIVVPAQGVHCPEALLPAQHPGWAWGSCRFGHWHVEGRKLAGERVGRRNECLGRTRGSNLLVCEVGWWHLGRGPMLRWS